MAFIPNQNPLSSLGSRPDLQDGSRTVPSSEANNDFERTPADITAYYQNQQRSLYKNASTYQYPIGIGSDEYPHWLKIQIHVREKNSVILQGGFGGTSGVFVSPEAKGGQALDTSSRAHGALVTGAVVGTSAANAAASATQSIARALPATFNTAGKLALATAGATIVAGVGGAVVGGVAGAISMNKELTLNSTIGLGLQEPPKAQYQTTWESQDLGEMMARGPTLNTLGGVTREVVRSRAGMKGAISDAAGMNKEQLLAGQDLASGKIKNPYKEQLFKQSEFRTHSFTFNILPDSASDALKIIEMFKLLRATMLPALDPHGFYLIYPAEYTLQYMYKNTQNRNVSAIGTCVLDDMQVSYGGQDFVVFEDRGSGIPAEFQLTLKFKEITPITADRVVQDGL